MGRKSWMAATLAASLAAPAIADDATDITRELKRLSARIEALEKRNQELERALHEKTFEDRAALETRIRDLEKDREEALAALASDRISEKEPDMVTRLKAVEFQTLSMQKQARHIEALEGITVGASLTGVVQGANDQGTASGNSESRANYRGDLSVTLPGGEMGDIEGSIFAHVRFGQGDGVVAGLKPTYTATPNTTAFRIGSGGASDSTALVAQAWYQLAVPLPRGGVKADSRENLFLTFGKIDSFVFFDQNAAADDESTKFLNNVFVHNPLLDSGGDIGADEYGFAPGAIVQYTNERNKGSEWGLSLGVFGSGPGADFSGSLSDPFVIAQAETAARINYLPGNYRGYLWTNGRAMGYDGIERRHSGVGLSIDQKVDDNLTLFGRYGYEIDGKVRFDQALTLGAELTGSPWDRAADSVGLAFGGLRTSSDFRNDSPTLDADGDGMPDFGYQASGWETSAELYYRYKVNSHFELTPDFQYIWRPAGDGSTSSIRLLGVRAKVGF